MLHLIENGETSSSVPRAFVAHYPGSDIDELAWAKLAVGDRQDLLNVVEVWIDVNLQKRITSLAMMREILISNDLKTK